jgi:ribonuclease HII
MTTHRLSHDFAKNFYEKGAWSCGGAVIGVDEVGRGCLAGPVVSAAVMLTARRFPKIITDSKVLTPQEREEAYQWIVSHGYFGLGIAHHRHIDDENIYQATLRSMRRAVEQLALSLPQKPSAILVDAMPLEIPGDIPIYSFCFGEQKSVSIAAASIVAKVRRDRLIQSLDPLFPQYGLAAHKGYSTPQHKTSVVTVGASVIHRMRFIETPGTHERQESLL